MTEFRNILLNIRNLKKNLLNWLNLFREIFLQIRTQQQKNAEFIHNKILDILWEWHPTTFLGIAFGIILGYIFLLNDHIYAAEPTPEHYKLVELLIRGHNQYEYLFDHETKVRKYINAFQTIEEHYAYRNSELQKYHLSELSHLRDQYKATVDEFMAIYNKDPRLLEEFVILDVPDPYVIPIKFSSLFESAHEKFWRQHKQLFANEVINVEYYVNKTLIGTPVILPNINNAFNPYTDKPYADIRGVNEDLVYARETGIYRRVQFDPEKHNYCLKGGPTETGGLGVDENLHAVNIPNINNAFNPYTDCLGVNEDLSYAKETGIYRLEAFDLEKHAYCLK